MRVIEAFVKYVPCEEIPADAKWFAQGQCGGELLSSCAKEKPHGSGVWRVSKSSLYRSFPIATDASETVVTREELMRAYDLVERGYTLWFGGECPVGEDAVIDVIWRDGREHYGVTAKKKTPFRSYFGTGYTVAYRLSRSVDKDVAAVNRVTNARDSASLVELDHAATIIAAAIEKRIELMNDEKWDMGYDKVCINSETGYLASKGSNLVIITRAQWDDYVSRKIRVGDKVKTRGGNEAEVLFVTTRNAMVRYSNSNESMLSIENLTRISQ